MLIIACISLLALMLLGVPITFSLLGAGFLAVLLGDGGLPMYMNCRGFISGVNSFTLMAIPFFMISGSIMNQGGLSKRIIQFCSSLFSWLRGGVGIVCVAANMIFGAVSGSGTAAVAAIGSITAPDMEKIGYKKEFTGAMIAGAASTAPIIPPSNVMIIFASITGLSITRMFLAGYTPGVAIGIILMVICHFYAKKHNIDYGGKFHLKAVITSLGECFWALLMPLIIIVGITAGFCTPTEAGALYEGGDYDGAYAAAVSVDTGELSDSKKTVYSAICTALYEHFDAAGDTGRAEELSERIRQCTVDNR